MSTEEREVQAANTASKWWGNMPASELSLKITQQSSELPNISNCCKMIKTALQALNEKNGATQKNIKKYICQKFKLNVAFIAGEFQTKISNAMRRMLATKEIVFSNGLFKLNSYGTESNELSPFPQIKDFTL